MRINYYIFPFLISLLLSCNEVSRNQSIKEKSKIIVDTHILAKENLDSVFSDLKEAEKLINSGALSDSLKGENNFYLGMYYANNGQLDNAAKYFYDATEAIEAVISSQRQVTYFNFAWNVHYRLGKYGDCLALSRKYESLVSDTDNHDWHCLIHYMNENVYKKTKDYDNAIKSNKKRIEILKKVNDTIGINRVLMSQAQSRFSLNQKKEAFAILDELVKKEKYLSNSDNRKLFGDYATYLSEEEDYKKSLDYYLIGLKYKRKLNSSAKNRQMATSYSNIAEIYIELKDYKTAAKYIDSVIALDLNTTSKSLQRRVLKNQLRLGMEDPSKSKGVLDQLDSLYAFQNNLYKDKIETELSALSAANEKEKIILQEKQAAEIQSLKLQTRQQFLIIIIILIGVLGYLFYRHRTFKHERHQLQMQQRLLRSQMNPHFTSNTLYSIQNLLKNSPKAASDYLVKFSRLLRLVLENSMSNYIQLEDELEALKKYLDLQMLRYDSKFRYTFVLNNMEEDDLIFIPPMLIQPIVENSIEHGLSGVENNGQIVIKLTKQRKFIECVVEDNGKGLIGNKNNRKLSASTKLINEYLRKITKSELKVTNKVDINKTQSGVLVTFLIPYKLNEDD